MSFIEISLRPRLELYQCTDDTTRAFVKIFEFLLGVSDNGHKPVTVVQVVNASAAAQPNAKLSADKLFDDFVHFGADGATTVHTIGDKRSSVSAEVAVDAWIADLGELPNVQTVDLLYMHACELPRSDDVGKIALLHLRQMFAIKRAFSNNAMVVVEHCARGEDKLVSELMCSLSCERIVRSTTHTAWIIDGAVPTIVNIVSADNGCGLSRDIDLLKRTLQLTGRCIAQVVPDIGTSTQHADVNIFLEHLNADVMNNAPINVFIPHPEWYATDRYPVDREAMPFIDFILTKTHHAQQCFLPELNHLKTYISWSSSDCLDTVLADNKNWSTFIHLPGMAVRKQTDVVLETWCRHPDLPRLIVVKQNVGGPPLDVNGLPSNITLIQDRLSHEMINELQNTYGMHLCPSDAEGFGHYINEARSCGNLIITTNGPPMNELVDESTGFLVPPCDSKPLFASTMYKIASSDLYATINKVLPLSLETKKAMGARSRERYLTEKTEFQRLFVECWARIHQAATDVDRVNKWLRALYSSPDSYVVRNYRDKCASLINIRQPIQIGAMCVSLSTVLKLHM